MDSSIEINKLKRLKPLKSYNADWKHVTSLSLYTSTNASNINRLLKMTPVGILPEADFKTFNNVFDTLFF